MDLVGAVSCKCNQKTLRSLCHCMWSSVTTLQCISRHLCYSLLAHYSLYSLDKGCYIMGVCVLLVEIGHGSNCYRTSQNITHGWARSLSSSVRWLHSFRLIPSFLYSCFLSEPTHLATTFRRVFNVFIHYFLTSVQKNRLWAITWLISSQFVYLKSLYLRLILIYFISIYYSIFQTVAFKNISTEMCKHFRLSF